MLLFIYGREGWKLPGGELSFKHAGESIVSCSLNALDFWSPAFYWIDSSFSSRNGLLRNSSPRFKEGDFHDELAYNDWVKTCEHYGIIPESEKRQSIVWMLNTCATQIGKKEIIFQWLLPTEKKSIKSVLEGEQNKDLLTTVLEYSQASVPGE
ncbi:MAG: hypothetical protein ACRDHW_02320, partial [Ktedonobacteraceae bacterium]